MFEMVAQWDEDMVIKRYYMDKEIIRRYYLQKLKNKISQNWRTIKNLRKIYYVYI